MAVDNPAEPSITYAPHARDLSRRLSEYLAKEEISALHERQAWRHFVVLIRQIALLAVASWILAGDAIWQRWLWAPSILIQGFVIFDFTVLLHEVVHATVFRTQRPRMLRVLGLLYAFASGLSASQFTRWHMDHHKNLGSAIHDPKRHHLTPKRNARWLKLLYLTPALFPIYFRAAARETATYVPALRRRIAWERRAAILGHVGILAALWFMISPAAALRIHLIPVFVVFPVAFVINRIGQHYDIDPEDPANWSTLMRSSPGWNFIYLWSNFHLEHHYYPGVPFYNLPRLQRGLRGFFEAEGIRARGYSGLLWDYLVRNREPHTDWS
jgi:beta-carotene hydroxylase